MTATLFDPTPAPATTNAITIEYPQLVTLLERGGRHVVNRAGRGTGYLWLWTAEEHLIGLACDKYGVSQIDSGALGDLSLVGVSRANLRQLLAELKAARAGWVTVALSGSEMTVLAEGVAEPIAVTRVHQPDPRDRDAVSHFVGLLQRHAAGETPEWMRGRLMVNPRLLAKWGDPGNPVRVWARGRQGAYVEVDDHWRGYLMLMLAPGHKLDQPQPARALPLLEED